MSDELTLELAKFFANAWEAFIDHNGYDLQTAVDGSGLAREEIATNEDIENGDAPEDCEEGDVYYVLTPLGLAAWKLAKEGKTDE